MVPPGHEADRMEVVGAVMHLGVRHLVCMHMDRRPFLKSLIRATAQGKGERHRDRQP
jgi:hypothetical protein